MVKNREKDSKIIVAESCPKFTHNLVKHAGAETPPKSVGKIGKWGIGKMPRVEKHTKTVKPVPLGIH